MISHEARTRAGFTRTSGTCWELPLLVCLALLLRVLWIAFFMRGAAIEPPGAEYADAARSLARHDYAATFVPGTTGVISPVYPVLLASASLLTQDVLSPAGTARLVTAAFGALLVVPVYLTAAFLYSRRVAAIAAFAVALHPLLLKTSSTALPDSIYLTLLLAGTYFLLRVSTCDRDTLSAITAGAFFGLAGLTRPEGLLCFIASVLIIALGVRQPWRETARQITLVLLAAAAVLAPYAALAIDAGVMPFQTTLMTASLNLAQLPAALTAVSLVATLVLGALVALGLLWSSANGIAAQLLLTNVVIGSAMGSASLPAIGLLPILLIWASHGLSELPRRLGERFGVGQHHPAWMQVVLAAAIISLIGVPVYRGVTEEGRASWILWDAGLWLREVAPVKKQVMDVSASIPFHASAQYVPFPPGDSRTAFEVISRLGVDFIVVRTSHAVSPSYLGEWIDHGVPDARARLVYSRQGRDAEQIAVYKWLIGADDFQPASILHGSGNQPGPRDESAALDGSQRGALRRNPQNRRYFTDESGRAIYLTGAHTWANLQDGDRLEPLNRFDFEQYLTFLQNHHLNFIRLWAWEQADWVPWRPYHFRIAPMPYVRVGPSPALDGKPQFDVTRFDDEYFQRLRERVAAAGARNIYVSVMLFQGWSVAQKSNTWENPWRGHPFHRANNVNGIDGDPRGAENGLLIHTLRDPRITTLQERYVEKIVDTLSEMENVLFEICNECDGSSLEWQSHMVRLIHRLESDRRNQHPVGMTALWPGGRNIDLFQSPADWISPTIEDGYDSDPPAADGTKVVIADTDHIFGIGGDRRWVWKSFLRGLNPIFMDPYDHSWLVGPGAFPPAEAGDARWEEVRRALRQTAEFAARIDLAEMVPRGDLCSSKFCLARPHGLRPQYLTYNPTGGRLTIDLRASTREMHVEWFDPKTGDRRSDGNITGGAVTTFNPPFAGDVVLHLSANDKRPPG